MPIRLIDPLPGPTLPRLENGDRLSRAEFERRYEAMGAGFRAELVEGVVYVASPVRYSQHARPHFDLTSWLTPYRVATPGVTGADNATVRLDADNEPQPDVLERLNEALGGRSRIDADGYVEGAPKLVCEVSASSASYDANVKRHAYRRAGVRE